MSLPADGQPLRVYVTAPYVYVTCLCDEGVLCRDVLVKSGRPITICGNDVIEKFGDDVIAKLQAQPKLGHVKASQGGLSSLCAMPLAHHIRPHACRPPRPLKPLEPRPHRTTGNRLVVTQRTCPSFGWWPPTRTPWTWRPAT